LHTARHITNHSKGIFPNDYEGLIALKGIGPYTAAAIASFAFNLPYAVVDGNVFRVLARFHGISTPTDTKEGIAIFNSLADQSLAKKQPGLYNQAIMDFGATVCTPSNPDCVACNLSSKCVAFNVNKVNQLPVKLKRITKKKRHFDFFCFNLNGTWMLQQRGEGDVWNGLFQFYVLEQDRMPVFSDNYLETVLKHQFGLSQIQWKFIGADQQPKLYKQVLTHQTIEARFICIQLSKMPKMLQNALWVKPKQLSKYAFPKIINDFLVTFHHGSALE
jgi:A/G-specific adenine glycosylase